MGLEILNWKLCILSGAKVRELPQVPFVLEEARICEAHQVPALHVYAGVVAIRAI